MAVMALRDEVQAHATYVFLGVEILRTGNGLALNLQFQAAQMIQLFQAAQMIQLYDASVFQAVAQHILQFTQHCQHVRTLQRAVLLNLGSNLLRVNHFIMAGACHIHSC